MLQSSPFRPSSRDPRTIITKRSSSRGGDAGRSSKIYLVMNEESDMSEGGIMSDTLTESDVETTNNRFYGFINSESSDLHNNVNDREYSKINNLTRGRDSPSQKAEDDPVIRLSYQCKPQLRRSHRIRAKYIQRVEMEEDGTFIIPNNPRNMKILRKSPRFHREVNYNERDLFSAGFSDQENKNPYRGNEILEADQMKLSESKTQDKEDEDLNHSTNLIDRIAGLDKFILKLREMIVFPLLYPEVFSNLGISPPRGVLFHGPPGTGKTLLARVLADTCRIPGTNRKVSFFMKNGSDCLSKWIGEAEKNLRLLFKRAREQQPSIIFFDEIDGLAPERTGKQDQSHISLVATLLALMDGLDDRGQVVVIGATNRINSIDTALRRPGRFDREFYFELPNEETRLKILKLHTNSWNPPVPQPVLSTLAKETIDFSGADLKSLCVEAALKAFRKSCPQAYDLQQSAPKPSEVVDYVSNLEIDPDDFYNAFKEILPSCNRRGKRTLTLSPLYRLLFQDIINTTLEILRKNEYKRNNLSWTERSQVHFVHPILNLSLGGQIRPSKAHIQMLTGYIATLDNQIRHSILSCITLCSLPIDLVGRHLQEALPIGGGILHLCGLDSLKSEVLLDLIINFIKEHFYFNSPFVLIVWTVEEGASINQITEADWDIPTFPLSIKKGSIVGFLNNLVSESGYNEFYMSDDVIDRIVDISHLEIGVNMFLKDLETRSPSLATQKLVSRLTGRYRGEAEGGADDNKW